MFGITENDERIIIRKMADIMSYAETEKDLLKIAGKLFAQSFEEATEADGLEIAERLYETITDFEEKKECVLRNGNVKETLDACLKTYAAGVDEKELLCFLSDAFKQSGLDGTESLNLEKSSSCEELSEALCEAVKNVACNFDFRINTNSVKEGSFWWNNKKNEAEIKVLYSMAVYCSAKREELSGVPNSVTPEFCALAVCGADEFKSFYNASEKSGEVSVLSSEGKTDYLSAVIIALIFVAVIGAGIFLGVELITGGEVVVGVTFLLVMVLLAIGVCASLLENSDIPEVLVENQKKRSETEKSEKTDRSKFKTVDESDYEFITDELNEEEEDDEVEEE